MGIKVFAPATIGNLGVGYDCLGMALERPGDEIIARMSDKPGLRITKITGKRGKKIPTDTHQNTAGVAAWKLLEHLGETERGIDLEIHKKMPLGSGLGSSAASAVAGAMAVNELLKRPLGKKELLPFAVAGESIATSSAHADNVAPSLIGGIVLIRDNATFDIHRLPYYPGLYATVIYPKVEILTKDARSILSDTVPLEQMVTQSANLASFIVAMYRGDEQLIRRCLNDVVIEPQRKYLIPYFDEVKEAALNSEALGGSISGSGPSIFMLSKNSLIAEDVAEAMKKVYHDNGIEYEIFVSTINNEGAIKL